MTWIMLTLFVSATSRCVFHLGHSSCPLFASLHFASSEKQQRSWVKLGIWWRKRDVGERLGWFSLVAALPHSRSEQQQPLRVHGHKSYEKQSIWWEDTSTACIRVSFHTLAGTFIARDMCAVVNVGTWIESMSFILAFRFLSISSFHYYCLLNFIDPSEYGIGLKTNQFRQESFEHINERPSFTVLSKSGHWTYSDDRKEKLFQRLHRQT